MADKPLPQRLQEVMAPPAVEPLIDEARLTLLEIKHLAQNATQHGYKETVDAILGVVDKGVKAR